MTDNPHVYGDNVPSESLVLHLADGRHLQLTAYSETLFLLSLSRGPALRREVSYAINHKLTPIEAEKREDGAMISLATEAIRIEVDGQSQQVKITDRLGSVRMEGRLGGPATDRGQTFFERNLSTVEGVYGLGEHGEVLNRNPGRYRIWNRDEPIAHAAKQYYCTIPFCVSTGDGISGPHGLFVDNPGELFFDVGFESLDKLALTAATGDMHLWLFFDDDLRGIVSAYTALTGRMERPPLWALGYQQCRWSYPDEKKIREIAQGFRDRKIPCDVIYFDIDYMEKYQVFTWSDERFPEPDQLIADLAKQGFRSVCIVDPGVAMTKGYFAWESGRRIPGFFLTAPDGTIIEEHVWPGKTAHPDFTNEVTRSSWQAWQWQNLLAKGIAGIWNDMNEPAIFGDGNGCKEYRGDAFHKDFDLNRPHREIHNVYGLTMAQTSAEGQKRYRATQRAFTLTRSGWAGIQRYSAVWNGDNCSSYNSMANDVALNLNMGMSGVAFVGCDIGGFAHHATPELFCRWMEWGVFQPFCRGHAAMQSRDQEPWTFGAPTERIVKQMIELRYRLLPYLYTSFITACETGLPINRPLVLDYLCDSTVHSISDHFLVGDRLLVAPILEPGKMVKAVYLPAGEWLHFWNHHRYAGGRWHLVEAPFGQPAVFVKEGTILPMQEARQSTAFLPVLKTSLVVYPGPTMEGLLVEDDGYSTRYQEGEEARVFFTGTMKENRLEVMISAPSGPFVSSREDWELMIPALGRRVERVRVDGIETEFEFLGGTLHCQFGDSKKRQRITVEFAG